MKNFSIVLNVVLIVAVAILYYLHFSGNQKPVSVVKTAVPKAPLSELEKAPIAYVDLDSLNEKIAFIRDKRKELEGEQKAIENEWMSASRALNDKKNEFIKKHDNGKAITDEMAAEFQTQLLQEQQAIEEKRQAATQKLTEKSYKFMDDIQKKLKDFLAQYNSNGTYKYILTTGTGLDYLVFKDTTLNITNDVIAGMNEKIAKENKK
ncbi:MAG: OmpH family outer membrane protein [Chitinophagaceae bacterium]|nr:OmpH family outer membrane protein [Bacteroidota bacterium]MCC6257986.1 OmpH family outer membrane protein [Chitinophagaceae bacterium]MCW5917797.1 OmpH family outer membrane protein [Ferruginibacter sp.]